MFRLVGDVSGIVSGYTMAQFAALCPELSGHLNPMTALARELVGRGHRVRFYLREAGRRRVEAVEGLRFRPFGVAEYPAERVAEELAVLARLRGLAALRHTVEVIRRRTALCLRDVPAMFREDEVDAVLTDQVTPEGATAAESLGLPYATVCNALALHQAQRVPPFFTTWRDGGGWRAVRNRLAYRLIRRLIRPVVRDVNAWRAAANLRPYRTFEDAHSPLLQLSQQPPEFDFPGRAMPAAFRYAGPFVDAAARPATPFPFERLDGRPLIYASMGTLQNGLFHVFRTIAAACAPLRAQLVISLGGGATPDVLGPLDGDPVVVAAAPQLELLKRAAICVTHAGLNTALECLGEGVPMVAIPVTNDQPGVAARVVRTGTGVLVPLGKLTPTRLRAAVERVMGDAAFKERAMRICEAIRGRNALKDAADHVELALLSRV